MVAVYLGAGFARAQLGLIAGSLRDEAGVISPLKLSFASYPPGTPKALEKGRIEYVAFDRASDSSERTAPWIGTGVLRWNNKSLGQCILGTNRCENFRTIETWEVRVQGENHSIVLTCPIACENV